MIVPICRRRRAGIRLTANGEERILAQWIKRVGKLEGRSVFERWVGKEAELRTEIEAAGLKV